MDAIVWKGVVPFTSQDTISKIEGFITSNGFNKETSSGEYVKYKDGRDYSRTFFIMLLVLPPFIAELSDLIALIYYFTRGKNIRSINKRRLIKNPDFSNS